MNLADAIRRAAQANGAPTGQIGEGEEGAYWAQTEAELPEGVLTKEHEMNQPHEGIEVPTGHNVVRLELVLNPEQLKGFFGAVIASQHSVLTLREAASFLRVSQKTLESLAEEGDIPGMSVDGKWRFTRQALEDWLCANPKKKEA